MAYHFTRFVNELADAFNDNKPAAYYVKNMAETHFIADKDEPITEQRAQSFADRFNNAIENPNSSNGRIKAARKAIETIGNMDFDDPSKLESEPYQTTEEEDSFGTPIQNKAGPIDNPLRP